MHKLIKLTIILSILTIYQSKAAIDTSTIPRFVSLKVSEANIRTGPGVKFPIKWIFIKKYIPLEILDSYDNWYNVRDEEQKQGWIHRSLISKARFFVIIKDQASLYKNPKHHYVTHILETGTRGKIKSCRSKWCEVKIDDIQGWIKKIDIWGVYSHEEL